MAIPRVFVSSTYYDLRHIRQGVESFVNSLGYDSVLFESGSIPFSHDQPLDESCYKEIATCHILVLIVGGRYGSAASDDSVKISTEDLDKHYQYYNSITKKEFETAISEDIPAYIFVEKGVLAEYQTYKGNRDNKTIRYAHVDSINVFRLIDSIYALKRNNLTRGFENLDDITTWLRDQWAGIFADFLKKKSSATSFQRLASQLESLENVTGVLKDYSEKIIEGVSPNEFPAIKRNLDDKLRSKNAITALLQVQMGRHLVEDHEADPAELIGVIKAAPSLKALQQALCELVSDCPISARDHEGALELSNAVRAALELTPIESRDPLDPNEFPRRLRPRKHRPDGPKPDSSVPTPDIQLSSNTQSPTSKEPVRRRRSRKNDG